MKVVILAGGFGTRISEESQYKPKPMLEIGGNPILWHIMKIYSHYGFNDFIVCAGYKQESIKDYFYSYFLHHSDITFDFRRNSDNMTIHSTRTEPWRISVVDTGLNTMTGGRLKRVKDYIGDGDFMLTYGDGVANVNIKELVKFHKSHGRYATITAVQPGGRFGALDISDHNSVGGFREKQKEDGGWINGGFMVLSPQIFKYITGDSTILEREPLQKLAENGQLVAFKHDGFWQCMDTLKDKSTLENLWNGGHADWKCWKD